MWPALLLLTFAISVDGLAAGAALGQRGIRVPWLANVVVAVVSALLIEVVNLAAVLLIVPALPAVWGARLAAMLFVVLGAFLALHSQRRWKRSITSRDRPWWDGTWGLADARAQQQALSRLQPDRPLLYLTIPGLRLFVRVWRDPEQADIDRSGHIDPREALMTGGTLAVDAAVAGLGTALAGWPLLWLPWAAGVGQVALLLFGHVLSERAPHWLQAMPYVPGSLFLVLGLSQLI